MLNYKRHLKEISRELRNNSTVEETILWRKINKKQIYNTQFYRQKPINSYIVDFYAPKVKLVIELDGLHHYDVETYEYDLIRTNTLSSMGIFIKRYDNSQIRNNLNFIISDIDEYIQNYYSYII